MDQKKKKGGTPLNPNMFQGTTLREENIGKKHVDVSSILRMQHLQKLATWAGGEASIPPLGMLFGHRLAANAEAQGIPLDPSIFLCHRCECILQPGSNCTVRIEKNLKKARRGKKSRVPSQNNVVYKCHFCSHHNLIRGTQRGYVKGLLASRPRPCSDSKPSCPSDEVMSNSNKEMADEKKLDQKVKGEIPLNAEPISELKSKSSETDAAVREIFLEKSPLTPLERLAKTSKKKRKKNGSAPNKHSISGNSSATTNLGEGTGGSSKRKRKGWSSLRERAKSNESESTRIISNFAIPFLL